jgi:hypothetical protein
VEHMIEQTDDDDEETGLSESADEIKEALAVDESDNIMNAPTVTMDELRAIRNKKSTECTRDEQLIVNRAYMVATFGADVVNSIGENHKSITGIK